MNKKIKWCSIIIIIILIDQFIKIQIKQNLYNKSIVAIQKILKITYIQNTGGAYSIGKNHIVLIIFLTIIILSILLVILFSKKNKLNKFENICLSIAVAGGLSNLIDRISRGYVIDYIDLNLIIDFPIFNIADICIVCGGVLLIIYALVQNIIKRGTE